MTQSTGQTSSTGCQSGDVSLHVVQGDGPSKGPLKRNNRMGRRRAIVLMLVQLAIIVHVIIWVLSREYGWFGGRTITPIEPSESMEFSKYGVINAGLIFFVLAMADREVAVSDELVTSAAGMIGAMSHLHRMWEDNARLLKQAEKLTTGAAERDPLAKRRARRLRDLRVAAPLLIATTASLTALTLAAVDELAYRVLSAFLRECCVTYITWLLRVGEM